MVRKGLQNRRLTSDEAAMLRQAVPTPTPTLTPAQRRPGKLQNKMIPPEFMLQELEKEQVALNAERDAIEMKQDALNARRLVIEGKMTSQHVKSVTNDHMTNVPCPPSPLHPRPGVEEEEEEDLILPSGIAPPPGLFLTPSFAPPPGLTRSWVHMFGDENL